MFIYRLNSILRISSSANHTNFHNYKEGTLHWYHRVRVCRDSLDMQYTIIPKKSLQNGKLISLDYNVPFIFGCFHDQKDSQWHKKHCESTEPGNSQNRQNDFLSSSSDKLAQCCVNLSWHSKPCASLHTSTKFLNVIMVHTHIINGTHPLH